MSGIHPSSTGLERVVNAVLNYTPGLSTLTGLITKINNVAAKTNLVKNEIKDGSIKLNDCQSKQFNRSTWQLLPVIGNIAILISDMKHKHSSAPPPPNKNTVRASAPSSEDHTTKNKDNKDYEEYESPQMPKTSDTSTISKETITQMGIELSETPEHKQPGKALTFGWNCMNAATQEKDPEHAAILKETARIFLTIAQAKGNEYIKESATEMLTTLNGNAPQPQIHYQPQTAYYHTPGLQHPHSEHNAINYIGGGSVSPHEASNINTSLADIIQHEATELENTSPDKQPGKAFDLGSKYMDMAKREEDPEFAAAFKEHAETLLEFAKNNGDENIKEEATKMLNESRLLDTLTQDKTDFEKTPPDEQPGKALDLAMKYMDMAKQEKDPELAENFKEPINDLLEIAQKDGDENIKEKATELLNQLNSNTQQLQTHNQPSTASDLSPSYGDTAAKAIKRQADEGNPQAAYQAGGIALAQGNTTEAYQYFQQAAHANHPGAQQQVDLADHLHKAGFLPDIPDQPKPSQTGDIHHLEIPSTPNYDPAIFDQPDQGKGLQELLNNVKRNNDPFSAYKLGSRLMFLKNYEAAIPYLKIAGDYTDNGTKASDKLDKCIEEFRKQPSSIASQSSPSITPNDGPEAPQSSKEKHLQKLRKSFEELRTKQNPDGKDLDRLGYLYENGIGTEKNLKEAINCYQQAVEKGNEQAFKGLDRIAHRSDLVTNEEITKALNDLNAFRRQQNTSEASNSKENHSPEDLYKLGQKHETGEGITPNSEEAYKYYEQAADQGNVNAMLKVGNHYLQKSDPESIKTGLRYLEKAADQGNAEAQFKLAEKYENGSTSIPKDLEKAAEYYKKCGMNGDRRGLRNLTRLNANNIKITKNMETKQLVTQADIAEVKAALGS